MSTQAGEVRAVMGQPASMIGAPGPREPEAYSAAVDMDSTRLRGGVEVDWGNQPPEAKCSLALIGQFLQME